VNGLRNHSLFQKRQIRFAIDLKIYGFAVCLRTIPLIFENLRSIPFFFQKLKICFIIDLKIMVFAVCLRTLPLIFENLRSVNGTLPSPTQMDNFELRFCAQTQ